MKSLILAGLIGISSFAFATPEAEVLKGIITDNQGITIQVLSGGCTDKSSFQVISTKSNPPQITFVRTRFDGCEAFIPFGTLIQFSWEELGLNGGRPRFVVNNPINVSF